MAHIEPDNLIRVTIRIARKWTETLWARRVGPDTARIDCIPRYARDVTLGSLVKLDSRGHVLYVLEKTGRNAYGEYAVTPDVALEDLYGTIRDHLAEHDIPTVGYAPGKVAMSVPNDISPGRLEELLAACPVPVKVVRDFGRRVRPR
ncbi:MAG TPA: DUF4265 domain-containing protein [Planctomycetaceae bacterium]|nr:DUF4265 domain-containing protein [Planctomycetaceae bacterium]